MYKNAILELKLSITTNNWLTVS